MRANKLRVRNLTEHILPNATKSQHLLIQLEKGMLQLGLRLPSYCSVSESELPGKVDPNKSPESNRHPKTHAKSGSKARGHATWMIITYDMGGRVGL